MPLKKLRTHVKASFHLNVELELNRSYFKEYDGGTPCELPILNCGAATIYCRSGNILPTLRKNTLACRRLLHLWVAT